MILYTSSTCPFSHRCRFVLKEKGADFNPIEVDPANKPAELISLNPYGDVPVLIERDLTLYQSTIINEYLDGITLQDILDQAQSADDYVI